MYCECGCGNITPIYQRNKTRRTFLEKKGEHARYCVGHNNRGKCDALDNGFFKQDNGCLYLFCAIDAEGYHRFWIGKEQYYGHIYFWQKAHGKVPDNLVVDHICKNRRCVNVEHLRLLNRHDNMMVGKYGEKFLDNRKYEY